MDRRTCQCRDRGWAKRSKGSAFGYKLHVKADTDQSLMQGLETTTVSVHDSRVISACLERWCTETRATMS
jgi:shikimate kinase